MVNANTTAIEEAVRLHRQGALAEAVSRYNEVLKSDPANSDALYYLAMAACQQGRFDEGIALARRSLTSSPAQPRAHNLVGMAQGRLGRQAEALASFESAIALAPELADAHGNRASALMELGRIEEAVAGFERAVALQPASIGDWLNLGAARHQLGRREEALASYDRALALDATVADAHFARGNVLSQLGRHADALASYDAAVARAPRNADAFNNRGNVLLRLGRPQDAIASFDQALGIAPTHVGALVNRGNALIAQGDAMRALPMAMQALAIRETPAAQALFIQCVSNRALGADAAPARPHLLRALSVPWERPADLAIAAISLVKLDPQMKELCARATRAWPKRLAGLGPGLAAMADDALLRTLLESVPICDVELERVLTGARQNLLDVAGMGAGVAVEDKLLGFFCALARQCFINEYVLDQTEDEARRVADLCARLDAAGGGDGPVSPLWVAAAAAYRPLNTLASAHALARRSWPAAVAALIAQQIREPLEERRLAADLPSLSPVTDSVSLRVKQQYEENPYPRWVKPAPAGVPKTMTEYFGSWHAEAASGTVDILFAGCGTGQNLVETARQFKGARVLAVDLSRASLGYAKRQAQALGLDNVTFAEADILTLGDIGKQFDIIDASGVLHHLADPFMGWSRLLSLLRPGGFMRLGFYSRLGRANVNAARTLIAERKIPATADGIRQARQEIIALPDGEPAKAVVRYLDFFAASECRDALFHVQEHQLALPELAAFIAANGMTFVAFITDPIVVARFQAQHPGRAATDLEAWHAFEAANPAAFAGMYQFWVRKNA